MQDNQTLSKLLTRIVDSADGYEQSAESGKSGALKNVFSKRARMRREFAAELRGKLEQQGIKADDDGSLLASAHRVFLDLKSTVMSDDNEKVLAEIERGETALIEQYEEALGETAPGSELAATLSKQLSCVREDLRTARELEDAAG